MSKLDLPTQAGVKKHSAQIVPVMERAFVQEYHFRNGNVCMMPCPPIRLESQAVPLAKSAPLIGEHTRQVLLNTGFAEDKIDEMIHAGAVK